MRPQQKSYHSQPPESVQHQSRVESESNLAPGAPSPSPPVSQRSVARTEIPAHRRRSSGHMEAAMPDSPKRRRSNDGRAVPVCDSRVPQKRTSHPQVECEPNVASSPLTELASSQMTATPQPHIDYQAVLLALADEYIAAAYSFSTPLAVSGTSDQQQEDYSNLIAAGLGCLESVLNNYRQMDPRTEARVRLRLATLMLEESDNEEELNEVLSKGISLCERSRLTDSKYAMHHLRIRVLVKSSPKAAFKALRDLVQEVEALGLVHWLHTFRFLRVSLCLQLEGVTDAAAVLKELNAIRRTADEERHIGVKIVAAVLETTVHLRSESTDAMELMQRALTAARTHQLSPEMQQMPQMQTLIDCLDLACALLQHNFDGIVSKMQQMQHNLDAGFNGTAWHKDGKVFVDIGPAAGTNLAQDTGGILSTSDEGRAVLAFQWIPKSQLYALGFMLSAVATTLKVDGTPEKLLEEGLKMIALPVDKTAKSLPAVLQTMDQQISLDLALRVQLVSVLCAKCQWDPAYRALQTLKNELLQHDRPMSHTQTLLLYLEAMCKHGMGNLQAALDLYSSASLTFDPATKTHNVNRDLQVLATLNRILIIRSNEIDNNKATPASQLLASIEPYSLSHPNKAFTASIHVLRATSTSPQPIIKTKQYLQSAITASKSAANNLLLALTMNAMTTTFFTGIVGDQAEKSAKAGRSLAKMARSKLWMAVGDALAADVLQRCGKGEEAEKFRREGELLSEELPGSLKRMLEVAEV